MKKLQLLSRVEINKKALEHNIDVFKSLIGRGNKNGRGGREYCGKANPILCLCIKANAYGHGLIECAKIIAGYKSGEAQKSNSANSGKKIWLGINSVAEAEILRGAGIKNPLYIMGYAPFDQMETAVRLGCGIVVYNKEAVDAAAKAAKKTGKSARLHIKLETGNNRQGVLPKDAVKFAKKILSMRGLILEGAATHFANIEDTTDHTYAYFQFKNFTDTIKKIETNCGVKIPIKHCANTAATMLFPKMHLDMVRVGIGLYGLWPSKETFVSVQREMRQRGKWRSAARSIGANNTAIDLRSVLSWKTRVAQVKEIPEGSYIGYGCTYKTTSKTRLAILPIGYYDGYDRGLSNSAYVLIKGKRAQIRGRVCMNITMVDITNIPGVKIDDEVVLIGEQNNENISIEQIADWCETINYEIPTRINEKVPRISV